MNNGTNGSFAKTLIVPILTVMICGSMLIATIRSEGANTRERICTVEDTTRNLSEQVSSMRVVTQLNSQSINIIDGNIKDIRADLKEINIKLAEILKNTG